MKKFKFIAGVAAIFLLMSFTKILMHVDIYSIDPKASKVEWFAKKVSGKHHGTIEISSGEVKNDHGKLTGHVEIDMTTIKNSDIEKEESKSKLENHLKSADFFDVANHPKSKFVITSIIPLAQADTSGNSHTVKGNLTIKDKTNEISFNANIKPEGEKLTCTGTMVVDRSKFDVRYGSKTFFKDIGDKMIDDEFTLKFNVVAVK